MSSVLIVYITGSLPKAGLVQRGIWCAAPSPCRDSVPLVNFFVVLVLFDCVFACGESHNVVARGGIEPPTRWGFSVPRHESGMLYRN